MPYTARETTLVCLALSFGVVASCSSGRTQIIGSQPHVQLIAVEPDVRLEVLDWGGSGRLVVLLAGSGNTAHVFDDFAPRLTARCCHVYGITRRGYGRSSHPKSGYDDQRLADDVLSVIDTLDLKLPVVIGHSMAGSELTTLGDRYSNRLGGLVYLDALADPGAKTTNDPAFMALYDRLPAAMKSGSRPDVASVEAYRAKQLRDDHFAFPESELRQLFAIDAGGRILGYRASTAAIHDAIGAGERPRDYSAIRVPILAISAFSCAHNTDERCIEEPDDVPRYTARDEAERAAVAKFDVAEAAYFERWKSRVRAAKAPVRFVDIPLGHHFIFLSHQSDVLEEITDLVAHLAQSKLAG
jgi:non-heme chloroperoxidase